MDKFYSHCVEKEKCIVLQINVKEMTRQLAETRATLEMDVDDRQATKNLSVERTFAGNLLDNLMGEFRDVKTSHEQALLARTAQMNRLKVQLVSVQKKAEDAEYERAWANTCLQWFQSTQQQYPVVLSHVHTKIGALDAPLAKDRNYLVVWIKHNDDVISKALVRKPVDVCRQTKAGIYEEDRETVNACAEGWQTRSCSCLCRGFENPFV